MSSTDSPQRERSLRRSTLLNLIPRFVTLAIAFGLSPFIVHHIGLRAFGFWSVLLAILQYVQVADGGFPTVAARIVARSTAQRDQDQLRAVIATTMLTLLVVASIIVVLGLAVPFLLPHQICGAPAVFVG